MPVNSLAWLTTLAKLTRVWRLVCEVFLSPLWCKIGPPWSTWNDTLFSEAISKFYLMVDEKVYTAGQLSEPHSILITIKEKLFLV